MCRCLLVALCTVSHAKYSRLQHAARASIVILVLGLLNKCLRVSGIHAYLEYDMQIKRSPFDFMCIYASIV